MNLTLDSTQATLLVNIIGRHLAFYRSKAKRHDLTLRERDRITLRIGALEDILSQLIGI